MAKQLQKRLGVLQNILKEKDHRIQEIESRIEKLSTKAEELGLSTTMEWPAKRIRETFLQFFQEKCQHEFYPSCPVVPLDDPTLLFINAGMNQYKPIFLGQVDPNHPMAKLTRACNSQKCIRAGGKHNDLEDVGKDVYHHTFFEMLGNWSFGSYFKKEAIQWSWELLTEVYQLDPNRLYATYFGGDDKLNLPPDNEAKEFWLNYLPADKVLPFGCKDNFWEMGDVGPCGPCTEIHYDRIGGRDASDRVNMDHPDVIEIWNNVFIQFNREASGKLVPLPQKHVDTGMGFERLASILQGKDSNYDTDVFMPLFAKIQELTGAPTYTGRVGVDDVDNRDMAYRVVADHIRTLTFAITDGAVPSNDGRGYVLRRILRRAVRYGKQILNAKNDPKNGFLTQLVPVVVDMLNEAFPELTSKQSFVQEIILDEEISFGKTLDKGIERFNKTAEQVRKQGKSVIPGEDAFFLYDTMGFPLDLTQLMAEEQGMTVDVKGYEVKMKKQTDRSKQDRKNLGAGGKPLVLEAKETSYLQKTNVQPTEDQYKYEWFANPSAKVVAIFSGEPNDTFGFVESTEHVKIGERFGIILDKTSFYAQSGGQIYDTGVITNSNGSVSFQVEGAESYAGFVLHLGIIESGVVKVGEELTCMVDYERRKRIAPNHTMTHVLNYALRKVLGTNADQRGSLVDDIRLRFDFTNNKALKPAQVAETERICEEIIQQQLPVYSQTASQAMAKRIQGLRAVFGETYPDFVRVISVGQEIAPMLEDPENSEWSKYSVEFCGGTHLSNTKEAEKFILFEECAVAKGIRRISAYTGEAAKQAVDRANEVQAKMDALETLNGYELIAAVPEMTQTLDACLISLPKKEQLRKQLSGLVNKIKAFKKEEAAKRMTAGIADAGNASKKAKESNEQFVILHVDLGTDGKLGNQMLEEMTKNYPNGSFLILSKDMEKKKTACFSKISSVHHEQYQLDARNWVNHTMIPMNGKGGGKDPLNANGQSKTIENIEQAVVAAKEFVSSYN